MSVIYLLYALLSMALLIYSTVTTDVGFLNCYKFCEVPSTSKGAVYLLIRYFVFIMPTELSWYIFYYMPKQFNAKMINSRYNVVDLRLGNMTSFSNDEVAMIEDLKINSQVTRIVSV